MANINSITSNSYSSSGSIYGSRNVLTGLASGMDTETMIENAVTGYQTKIQELQQSQTKIEWKQDAYRELIDQMYNITDKYTSYTKSTNLSSNSFFTNNVTTTANGTNASAVTATGKASSDIRINAVTQLASAARYAVDASALDVNVVNDAAGSAINWSNELKVGQLSGTMTIKVGSNSLDIKFTEDDKYDSLNDLVDGINEKLSELSATSKKAGSVKGDDLVRAELDGNTVKLVYTGQDGDSAYINSVGGNLAKLLGAANPSSTKIEDKIKNNSFIVPGSTKLVDTPNMAEYLSGKTVDFTLDGFNKQITIGNLADKELTITVDGSEVTKKLGEMTADELGQASGQLNGLLAADMQASVDKQFGKGKVTVGIDDTTGGLRFDVAKDSGSTLKVTSNAGKALFGTQAGVSNYFNTSNTLKTLLDTSSLNEARMKAADGEVKEDVIRYFDKDGNELTKGDDNTYYRLNADGSVMTKDGKKVTGTFHHQANVDAEGNLVIRNYGEEQYYRVNEKGEWLYGLEINGATIGGFTEDTTLESVLNKINSSADAGVKVSYSNLTSQFVFTATETGEGGKVEFGGGLAKKLFAVDVKAQKLGNLLGSDWKWNDDGTTTLKLGSTDLGTFTKNTTLKELMDAIDDNDNISSHIDYSDETGFTFNATLKSGDYALNSTNGSSIKAMELFSMGPTYTAGTDAIIDATVNGKQLTLKRSSNVVEMDGLSVTLKEEFSAYDAETNKLKTADAVTFTTSTNADAVVDAIKSFVEDVNKLMTSIHDAYATQPLTKSTSSGKGSTYTHKSGYEPLTEEDKKDMSESAVAAYEEKAKTGLLFGDSDLRNLYSKLLDSIQGYGADRVDMKDIGLETAYSGGVTTIKLNETKLREMLESDPDKVRNVFTKTKDSGAATDGLMTTLKTALNLYGSTSSGSPGILVSKAGTKLSAVSLLNNNLAKQISNLDSQIESWQTKLSNKIDYYTKQFTQLEKLMSTMNNQSSMLADMMGY